MSIIGRFDPKIHEKIIKPGKKIKLSKEEIEDSILEGSSIAEKMSIRPRTFTYEIRGNPNLFAHAHTRECSTEGDAYFNPRGSLGKSIEKKVFKSEETILKEGDSSIKLTEEEAIKTERKNATLKPESFITKDMLSIK